MVRWRAGVRYLDSRADGLVGVAEVMDYPTDYPTDEQLETIKTWQGDDLHGLMAYIKSLWNYADIGYWEQEDNKYILHTGGWSGNEDLIVAMQENAIFCMMFWYQTRRGGHYIFWPIRDALEAA